MADKPKKPKKPKQPKKPKATENKLARIFGIK